MGGDVHLFAGHFSRESEIKLPKGRGKDRNAGRKEGL
jgi:hypothetical protein